jgi:thiamine biosynthesis lipoprotein
MPTVTLARHAMATRFELVLHGASAAALRAAGEEALAEVDRLENQLSLYRPGSEIAQVNARAAHEPVRVSAELFALLQHAQRLHAETEGAFDITIAPLVRCWGFMGGSGKMPTPEELTAARQLVGMGQVQLNAGDHTVRFACDGVMLDLGAIGKGYAVERGTALLREAGVTSALFHGGTSTVGAIGHPPDADFWSVAIERPPAGWPDASELQALTCGPGMESQLTGIRLHDEAMSVSAIWGRAFAVGGKHFGHVMDPRTGRPTEGGWLAVVVLPAATETDVLSTALLTRGAAGFEIISRLRLGQRSLLVQRAPREAA